MTDPKHNDIGKFPRQYDQLLLDHYEKVARMNGLAGTCSIEDQEIRKAEVDFFLSEIAYFLNHRSSGPKVTLLDVGCGNGFLLAQIQERFPEVQLFGIEFSPPLFELASSRQLPNTSIALGDARLAEFFPSPVDIVITERAVINILNRRDQSLVIKNLSDVLKPGGIYLQSESYQEPLDLLNQAKKEMGQETIEQSKHNLYLNQHTIERLSHHGLKEVPTLMPSNFLSTHFFLTRVFHKAVLPAGGKAKYSLFVEFFREALRAGIGNFSPILFRKFQK